MKKLILPILLAVTLNATAQCPNILTPTCAPTCTDIDTYLGANGICAPYIIWAITWDCVADTGIVTYDQNDGWRNFVRFRRGRFGQLIAIDPLCC